MSWDNCSSFGVDNTNSNNGSLMKFVKPLIMQLYKYYNIPYANTQNQVEDCKSYIRLITSVIQKKCITDPFNFLDSFCLLKSEGSIKKKKKEERYYITSYYYYY